VNRILHALWGARRLAQFDKSGLAAFEPGWPAARHSFLALALALPLMALMVWLQSAVYRGEDFGGVYMTARLASSALGWLGFVLLLFPLTRIVGRRDRVLFFIGVFNWTTFIALIIQLPPLVIAAAGLVDFSGYVVLVIGFLLLVLVYKGYVASVALGIGALEALFIVIAELVFDIATEMMLMRVFTAL